MVHSFPIQSSHRRYAILVTLSGLFFGAGALADMGEPPRAGRLYHEAQDDCKQGEARQSASDLVKKFYEKLGQGDLPGMMDVFAPDAKWVLYGPTEIPFVGVHEGKAAIQKFIETFGANAAVTRFEPNEFLADKHKVVVQGYEEATATPTGKEWKAHWTHSFTVQRGKIVSVEEVLDTAPVLEAFTP